jgi:glycosyltransferase involved in cell wall biosynthesis
MSPGNSKIRVFRVVTAPEAVNFHLRNTLDLIGDDFETTVVGDNVEVFTSQFKGIHFKNLKIQRKTDLISDFIALFRLFYLLRTERPHIVHSIMPKAGLLAALASLLAGVPVRLHTFTGQTWASASGFRRYGLVLIDRFINLANTICYTDSKSQSEFLMENGIDHKGDPLPFLGDGSLSGVNMERFSSENIYPSRTEYRKKLGLEDGDVVFTYLGRKNREKGLFELLEAFRKIQKSQNNCKLLLVGPDETQGLLESVLTEFSAPVINLPLTTTPELFLNISDVFCIPSYREGFGSVVIEAAALGVPSIGTKIPGLVDSIIDQKTGLLVPVKDVIALYNAMSLLYENKALRKTLSEEARKNARKNFDSKALYKGLSESYRNLLKEKGVL